MPYRFQHDDGTVEAGVRRIACEQIDRAIAEIDDPDLPRAQAVHQVRKRCKKLRGLIRLVRPVFDDYGRENAVCRDAAKPLAELRDAAVHVETYDMLVETYADQIDRRALGSVRRRLTLRRKATERVVDAEARIAEMRNSMVELRGRASRWRLKADGFEAVAGGLGRTYKRARKTMAKARGRPGPERLHEWRKRAKYHWYHERLLRPVWSKPMKAHADAADDLGELLGDHHDLAVFRDTIAAEPKAFGRIEDVETLIGLIERRQAELEARSFVAGARLFAEPGDALKARWGSYWSTWREASTPPRRAALVA